MSETAPTTGANPKKCSACDRCRSQKLRCLRHEGQGVESPCLRCLQSGLECATGTRRPPGRPAGRVSLLDSRHNHSVDRSNEKSDFDFGESTGSTIGIFQLESLHDFALGNLPGDNLPGDNLPGDNLPGDNLPGDKPSARLQLDYLSNELADSAYYFLTSQHATGAALAATPSTGHSTKTHEQHLYPQAHGVYLALELSEIQRKISSQLFILTSVPWDVSKVLNFGCLCSSGAERHPVAHLGDEVNPLASTFQILGEFQELLETLGMSESTGMMDTATTASQLGITQQLTVLSCYLQFIAVFDVAFSKILGDFTSANLHNRTK
ncbi:hypothetical protein G7054_g15226 [Neopestalotiopsis clavispora]|nr:hypothetical protein G7054_g15226 [Neopestalotiopsis clavispora]